MIRMPLHIAFSKINMGIQAAIKDRKDENKEIHDGLFDQDLYF
jgi:hypothetical protein